MLHRPVVTLLVVAALGAATGACRGVPGSSPFAGDIEPADESAVVLEIENHNWSDINVYVFHDGRRDRLTTVTGVKDVAVNFPARYHGETGVFRLAVFRIGGTDSFVTEPISVHTGNTVRLTVESNLSRSSVGVW